MGRSFERPVLGIQSRHIESSEQWRAHNNKPVSAEERQRMYQENQNNQAPAELDTDTDNSADIATD